MVCSHASLLCFHLDWIKGLPVEGPKFSLQDLRMMVYLMKYPDVRVGVTRSWTFNPPMALMFTAYTSPGGGAEHGSAGGGKCA